MSRQLLWVWESMALVDELTWIALVPGQAPEWKLPPEQPSAVFRQRPEPAEVEHVFLTQHWTLVASWGQ